MHTDRSERWATAGAWQVPVGDPYAIAVGLGDIPAFHENRGVERSGGRVTHQGSDLANGRAGDAVRAAASGLVVRTEGNASNGYGGYIVLAHQLPTGDLLYSVYAHLLRGTIRVRAGDIVTAGEPLARVGQTGRATTPHLHFELRSATDASLRWEKAPVIEPLAYVLERLPVQRADTTALRPYLEWAEYQALLGPESRAEEPLTHAAWWRMLASAAHGQRIPATRDADALRDTLVDRGLLPIETARQSASARMDWESLTRDLQRLVESGLRLSPPPVLAETHREHCVRLLDMARPLAEPKRLARREDHPTTATACVLLASACGPHEPVTLKPTPKSAKRRAKKPRRASGA